MRHVNACCRVIDAAATSREDTRPVWTGGLVGGTDAAFVPSRTHGLARGRIVILLALVLVAVALAVAVWEIPSQLANLVHKPNQVRFRELQSWKR
jgi:hypothetical protein